MRFAKGARKVLRGQEIDSEQMEQLLRRVEWIFPHLYFESWRVVRHSEEQDPTGGVYWKDRSRLNVGVEIVSAGVKAWSVCRRDDGAISKEDYEFLFAVMIEGAIATKAMRSGGWSVVDFGTDAVAMDVGRRLRLEYDVLPMLQFIRSLGSQTYENQRVAYGVVLTRRTGGSGEFWKAEGNKRLRRVTDGFSTALALDGSGRILELIALVPPATEGTSLQRRPWWTAGLAVAAKHRKGVAVALSRNGDIVVVHGGRVVFGQRGGRWRMWSHATILARLHGLWQFRGKPGKVNSVLTYLYHVAMDLSFRRCGGLLVVVASRKRLGALLASTADKVGARGRGEIEEAFDESLRGLAIQEIDRRVVGDLASMDGALIVDRQGHVLAFGAMTKTSHSAHEGARTRAAIGASRLGVAIKVSSDGDIAFFRKGKKRFEI